MKYVARTATDDPNLELLLFREAYSPLVTCHKSMLLVPPLFVHDVQQGQTVHVSAHIFNEEGHEFAPRP